MVQARVSLTWAPHLISYLGVDSSGVTGPHKKCPGQEWCKWVENSSR